MYKKYITLALALFCLLPVSAQQIKELLILQTSDTHSRLEPIDPNSSDTYAGMGGTVRRVSLIKNERKTNPYLLLLDCGDISQGTPYYNLFKGEVEVKMMNLMKYDAMAVGNHEFDFGMDNMARLFRLAEFPIVCANYGVEGTVLEGLVKPYTVLNKAGLRIGVFGLGAQLEGLVQADKSEGVVYKDPIVTAQETAELLRTRERCDVVICLSHLGFQLKDLPCDEELVRRTSGIDAILGGHSHTFMQEPAYYLNLVGETIPVLHSGKNGINVGKLILTLSESARSK